MQFKFLKEIVFVTIQETSVTPESARKPVQVEIHAQEERYYERLCIDMLFNSGPVERIL